jgi:hypothetical protein
MECRVITDGVHSSVFIEALRGVSIAFLGLALE